MGLPWFLALTAGFAAGIYLLGSWRTRSALTRMRRCSDPTHRADAPRAAAVLKVNAVLAASWYVAVTVPLGLVAAGVDGWMVVVVNAGIIIGLLAGWTVIDTFSRRRFTALDLHVCDGVTP